MTQIKLRIPPELKNWLETEARLNRSSQNSEIIRCIRQRMEAKGPASAPTLPSHDHDNPPSKETMHELSTQ